MISFGARTFLIFALLLNVSYLHASIYDDEVLEIFSKILPRFVLMSSQKEHVKNDIDICILHDINDENIALSLMEKIENNYPKGIKNYKIHVLHSRYADIDICQKTQLTFMLNSDTENIEKSLRYLKSHAVLALSYDPKLLQYGVHASLFLGRKVVPYMNVKAINESGITFENILLRVSKLYYENEQ